jgi:hypothetical protein
VSRERARRREEREREAAIRAAARAREEERRQRAAARKQRLFGWVPRPRLKPGILARRARARMTMTVCLLVGLNIVLWIVRPDWEARFAGVVLSLLAAPVLYTMLFRKSP